MIRGVARDSYELTWKTLNHKEHEGHKVRCQLVLPTLQSILFVFFVLFVVYLTHE